MKSRASRTRRRGCSRSRFEAQRGPKRLEAQKRLSKLTLEQLGDLEKTFILDEAIVPLDPTSDEVRTRFVKLASALDKQLEATRALTRAAAGTREPVVRARISADMGDLYKELGDGRKARSSYQAVLDAGADAEATLRSARAIRSLSVEPRDPKGLIAVLTRLAEIEPEEDARLAAVADLARVAEEELRDLPAAIAAFERLLGTSLKTRALEALARLYEATGAYPALVATLKRLGAKETDLGRARDLAFQAADLRGTRLPDRAGAIEAWRAFVAAYGLSREVLARTMPLYEHEHAFDDLAAALTADIGLAPPEERPALLARLAQLRQARLNDPKGALEAYRQALSLDPSERNSRAAIDRLIAASEIRLEAADVLEPIARAEGSAVALLRVLEVRAALLTEPSSGSQRSARPPRSLTQGSTTRGAGWSSRRAGSSRRSRMRWRRSRGGLSESSSSRPEATSHVARLFSAMRSATAPSRTIRPRCSRAAPAKRWSRAATSRERSRCYGARSCTSRPHPIS